MIGIGDGFSSRALRSSLANIPPEEAEVHHQASNHYLSLQEQLKISVKAKHYTKCIGFHGYYVLLIFVITSIKGKIYFRTDKLEVHNNELKFWKNLLSVWLPIIPQNMKIFDQMIGNCQNTKARLNAFYAKFPHLKNYFIFSHHMIAKVTKECLATHSIVIFIVCVSKGILNSTVEPQKGSPQ